MNLKSTILRLGLLTAILLLAAACGPAANPDAGSMDALLESEAVSAAQPAADAQPTASPTRPPITIEPETAENDATGVPVGFTEEGRPYRGNPDAPIILEEFSDYQCPFCTRFTAQTLPTLESAYIATGEMMLVYYDFPLVNIHPQAVAAANAARCAGEQSAAAFWQMHDLLYMDSESWSISNPTPVFIDFAETLGLDGDAFAACVEEERYLDAIEADVELALSRGVRSTPSFFINDQPLVGAQPLSQFEAAISIVQDGGELAAATPEPTPASAAPADPALLPTPASIPLDTAAADLGDAEAPITIIEYTDYQCPYCARHVSETMDTLIAQLVDSGRVRYVVKDFPLDSLHPDARTAAAAARCAGEQDAYWPMHDAIFNEQGEWSGLGPAATDYFTQLADDLGLNTESFAACMEDGRYDDVIQANLEEGMALGVNGTPHFFIDGYPVVGAQPYELFEYAVGLAEAGTLQQAYAPPPTPTPAAVATDEAFAIGEPDAPVTIIEFTDFQCPYCSRHFAQTFPQIKENFIDTGLVRYVFKDFPLTNIHPQASKASEAARCAGEQDAYLAMHQALFANQQEWSGRNDAVAIFAAYAETIGLDVAAFTSCLETNKYAAAVEADLQEGVSLGVNGTPAFFLNGYFVSGAQPYDLFEEAIVSLITEE